MLKFVTFIKVFNRQNMTHVAIFLKHAFKDFLNFVCFTILDILFYFYYVIKMQNLILLEFFL